MSKCPTRQEAPKTCGAGCVVSLVGASLYTGEERVALLCLTAGNCGVLAFHDITAGCAATARLAAARLAT